MQTETADICKHINNLDWNHWFADVDDGKNAGEALRDCEDQLSSLVARISSVVSCAELLTPVAAEIKQALTALVINSRACQRWLSADPPNIREARAALEGLVRNANAVYELANLIAESVLRCPGTLRHNT
jgi:hypothetical protein